MPAKSAEAKARQIETDKERYRWYREHGICPRCGQRYADPGVVYCGPCRKRIAILTDRNDPGRINRNAYNQQRRAKLKSDGICTDCGKAPAEEGHVRCAHCEQKARESRKRYGIIQKIEREAREARDRSRQKGDGGNG